MDPIKVEMSDKGKCSSLSCLEAAYKTIAYYIVYSRKEENLDKGLNFHMIQCVKGPKWTVGMHLFSEVSIPLDISIKRIRVEDFAEDASNKIKERYGTSVNWFNSALVSLEWSWFDANFNPKAIHLSALQLDLVKTEAHNPLLLRAMPKRN